MQWYYMENFIFFTETVAKAFKKLNIPLSLPNFDPLTGTETQLKDQLNTVKPDIILTNGWTPFHQEKYLNVIKDYCRSRNAFHVFWSLEDPLHTELWSKYIIEKGQPDFVFTHEYGFDHFYHKRGIPSAYLPLACHPPLHNKNIKLSKNYETDISIVGNYNSNISFAPFRVHSLQVLLYPLLKQGYKVKAYGKGWDHYLKQLNENLPLMIRRPISYQDVPKVYAGSKITLGIQNTPQLLTRRTFESMGSGGFLLTMDTPAVRRHFTPQQHLAVVGDEWETLDAVKTYLGDDAIRRHIALQGQQEVHDKHTYEERMKHMAQIVHPYVLAKKRNKTLFVLPNTIEKEIKPLYTTTVNDKNYCRSNDITVSGGYRTNSHYTYLKFHIKKEKDYKISKAFLKLFLSRRAIGDLEVLCYQTLTEWSQESLSNGKRPKLGPEPISRFKVDKPFQTIYPWSGNWYDIDITPIISQRKNNESPYFGLCLKGLGHGKLFFAGNHVKFNRHQIYKDRFSPRMQIECKRVD